MIFPPGRLPASQTATARPPRASHQAEASPEIPPPMISTSNFSICSRRRFVRCLNIFFPLVRPEFRPHFLDQFAAQQFAGVFSCRNEALDGRSEEHTSELQ